ncbi:MAG: gliding motility-associated C-terminal domain-containing protein [Haliscomenobacter sp.]|nr:gliding motility-associated C-terminal domain-containing protein [Haliscomenobacter sp.]
MHGTRFPLLAFLLVFALSPWGLQAQEGPYGFLENKGQIRDQWGQPNPDALFLLPSGNGLQVQLRKDGFSYDAYRRDGAPGFEQERLGAGVLRMHRIDVVFAGANPDAWIEARDPASDYLLYYPPGDTTAGIRVRHYRKIVYRDVYPHIDVEFVAWPDAQKPVEYNFLLKPGAKLSDIRMTYTGASKAEVEPDRISLPLSLGHLSERIPASFWQDNRQPVGIQYRKIETPSISANVISVGFQGVTGIIDRPLVIDPTPHLDWGSYYGGSDLDEGRGMALDRQGNAYAIGRTQSVSNIATAGVHQTTFAAGSDALIVKFNTSGARLWGAYYGGAGNDSGQAIEVDAQGNVYAVGATESANGIATPGAFQILYNAGNSDAFLVKLRPDGTRIWGTYFGGPDYEFGNDLAIDRAGNVFITGWTISSTGIATMGSHQPAYTGQLDGFVAKFNPGGARLWSTYFGDIGFDLGLSTVTDASGNVLISGWTSSTSAIATAGAYQTTYGGGDADAFILKFAGASGALQWGTYYGGAGNEYGDGLAADAAGNLYITGPVNSGNAHTTPGTHQTALRGVWDAFVAKFDPSGIRLWGTYFGGDGDESGYGIRADPAGSGAVFVSGFTNSANGIATADAHQIAYGGGLNDAFLAKFSSAGTQEWGSYFGGNAEDRGYGIDVDSAQVTYLVGWTASSSGIANAKGHQTAFGGGMSDILVARFSDCYAPPAPANTNDSTELVFCGSANTVLRALGEGALTWYDAPTGGTLLASGDSLVLSALTNTRAYYVQDSVCAASSTRTPVIVAVNPIPEAPVGTDVSACGGLQPFPALTLTTGAGLTADWYSSAAGGAPLLRDALTYSPTASGIFYAETRNPATGCVSGSRTPVALTLNPTPSLSAGPDQEVCQGASFSIAALASSGTPPYRYAWSNGDTTAAITLLPASPATLSVSVTDSRACTAADQVVIRVNPAPIANAGPDLSVCSGQGATLNGSATGGTSPYRFVWSTGAAAASAPINPATNGAYFLTVTDSNGCLGMDQIGVTVVVNPTVRAGSDQNICAGAAVALTATPGGGTAPYRYAWTTGDSLASISVTPASSSVYSIVLTDSNNCSASDEVQIQVIPMPVASIQGSSQVCLGSSVTLTASGGSSFQWNTGSTASRISVSPGVRTVYEVVVLNSPNCSDTTSVTVEVLPLPAVSLPEQVTLRQGESRQLDAGSGADAYQWTPTEGLSCTDCPDPVLQPQAGATYCVAATKDGCSAEACIEVAVSDECPVFVPNAFSPNGDQVNDLFCPYSNCLPEFTLEVYSRWGALLFAGTGSEACWDGKQGGQDQNSGAYVYKIEGTTLNGKKVVLAGEFSLLR